MGLTDIISLVQREIPHFLTITVGGSHFDSEWLHMKINNIYVPLDYEPSTSKINDLIDLLHNYSEYKSGDGFFQKPIVFTNKYYFNVHEDWLYEISRNLGQTPVILFISKNEWFVDVSGSGPFYPLKKVPASEFVDYLEGLYKTGEID